MKIVTVRPNFQDSVHVGHITGLKKFSEYFTSVLCFTTPGDGPRSPPRRLRTHEDSEFRFQHAHIHTLHGYCCCSGLSISRTSESRMTSDPGFNGNHTHISRYTVPVKVSQSDLWPVFSAPGAVGHLSFTEILDTSLKVSWREPNEKNGVLTGELLTNISVTEIMFVPLMPCEKS